LLSSVTAIDGRYGVTSAPEEETTTLSGTHIFQKSFDTLKKRIRKSQKEKSISRVTRWALHDATQFKETILRLTAFVDGLYQVTTSLGLLQQRYEDLRIHEEINAITDGTDLELLAEATSKHSGSSVHRTVSDTASKRLSLVAASVRDCDTNLDTRSRPHSNASTSFYTAKTGPSQRALKAVEEEDSEEDDPEGDFAEIPSSAPESTLTNLLSLRSCAECDEASLQCYVAEDAESCANCLEDQKECSFDLSGSFITPAAGATESLRSTPQHERLMAESVARAGTRVAPRVLSFEAGDAHHGDQMKEINDNNLDYWIGHVASFHSQAYGSGSVAKRMFHELKTIRKAKVPFISAIPVGDDLSRILASIEGPPETPYEGGIFWILVLASQKAPILRFHTKIYHPNIDHSTGVLCADFQQKWNPAKIQPSLKKHFAESTALWSERTSPDMWSLLSLLIAICGLLASPNVNDPLVPDIAQKLVQDPDHFYEIAKKWTAEHAKASDKPDEASLQFPDEPSDFLETVSTEPMPLEPENDLEYSSLAMQAYLRSKYDEKFDDDWITSSSSSRHSFASSRMSNSVTKTASGERESLTSEESRTETIVDTLLLLDAKQSHLRQLTGEHLSNIEQWRMVREVRLALDKQLCRATPGISQEGVTPKFWTTDSRIRTLIKASAIRLYDLAAPEALRQYFNILAASFSGFEPSKLLPAEHHESLDPIPVTDRAEPNRNSAAELKPTTAMVSSPADRAVSLVLSVPTDTNSDDLIDEHHLPSSSSNTGQTLELTSTASTVGSKLSESRDHPVATSRTSRHSPSPYYPSGAIPSSCGSLGFPYASHGSYSHTLTPSPSHHSRYYSRDALQNPLRPSSPRYASTGYYGTSTNTSRKQSSWSAPRREAKWRNSNSYRASYGEPDEDDTEYLEYLIDGIVYRVFTGRPKKSTYTYRGHGADPYYYSQAQYAYDRDDLGGSPQRQRRQSSSTPSPTPSRPHTARPMTSPKKPPPALTATEADARRCRIPPGYSLKNWDPAEEPIMLLGSVFDANSLGKWIYDWTVYHHGPATPIADIAAELWLLLIQLAGKVKRAEECMPRIRKEENREMVEDFIDSGGRLGDKLKKLLRACEAPMLRAGKFTEETQLLGKNAGTEFVDTLFGRDRQLEDTEKFMSSIRLWNLRFDANCGDILRWPGQSEDSKSTLSQLIMTPVVIRTAFGLEDIAEELVTELMTDTTKPTIDTSSPSSDPKRARVEAQKIKSKGFLLADMSIDQPQMVLSPEKSMVRADTKGAVPSASVTSPDNDLMDWPSFSGPKKGKKTKRRR
jgi:ubiquitin-protein ligase